MPCKSKERYILYDVVFILKDQSCLSSYRKLVGEKTGLLKESDRDLVVKYCKSDYLHVRGIYTNYAIT